jgi:pimeloyl-ACP methyl ester carboxylesterase
MGISWLRFRDRSDESQRLHTSRFGGHIRSTELFLQAGHVGTIGTHAPPQRSSSDAVRIPPIHSSGQIALLNDESYTGDAAHRAGAVHLARVGRGEGIPRKGRRHGATDHMSGARIEHFSTPSLSIACEISGPSNGRPTLLLHGWPDDARTWDRVLPALHAAGHRTMVPYLRGCGPTRFQSPQVPRNGQLVALGQDVLDLADAMDLRNFAVVGHDWGSRAVYIASALAPQRVTHCVALSVGWATNDAAQRLSFKQVQNYWYHWYMALDRGAALVREERRELTRYIWTIWNPGWRMSDEEFAATAASFDNPDWAEVVLHSYRVRWGLAPRDAAYADLEARIARESTIRVPTLVIHGGGDPVNDPSTSEGKERFFKSRYERIVLDRVGHFPQREAPAAVADAVVRFLER